MADFQTTALFQSMHEEGKNEELTVQYTGWVNPLPFKTD